MQVVSKNASEEYRIEQTEYLGHDLVSIRIWFKSQDGDMRPSKKGVSIPVAKFDEVLSALNNLNQVIQDDSIDKEMNTPVNDYDDEVPF
jgi:hypothetical protein